MSKPRFPRFFKNRSTLNIPARYSFTIRRRSNSPNMATRRILQNFYHLNNEPTQREIVPEIILCDQETSTDDLPGPEPPVTELGISPNREPVTSTDDENLGRGNSRFYIRVKKSFLRKLLERLRLQGDLIRRYEDTENPIE